MTVHTGFGSIVFSRFVAGMFFAMTAGVSSAVADEALIERGRMLFVGETFGGNGRTCATCHRPDNNYTIDPAYISRLSPSDPLFIAEWNPALAGLERPNLMRQVGLVATHVDGYDKPAVFRSVPPLSGLGRTVQPGADLGRASALGLSGDAAPSGGAMREFITSAVIEHMPKSLARVSGSDYRLPAEDELIALEAFLLSLGPQDEFDIGQMSFTAAQVEQGKTLFLDPRSGPCSDCHRNAGALDAAGVNGLFDVGVQHRPGSPGLRIDPTMPADGGFGAAAPLVVAGGRTGFGDGRFNPPSLIEAADTAPYFHDNSAPTLEAAIFYYTSPSFAASPEGRKRPQVVIERFEVAAIGAFLRTINAFENIRSANARVGQALALDLTSGSELVRLAGADTEDAFRVLYGASGIYPTEIRMLLDATVLMNQASAATSVPARNDLLTRAVNVMNAARASMVN